MVKNEQRCGLCGKWFIDINDYGVCEECCDCICGDGVN